MASPVPPRRAPSVLNAQTFDATALSDQPAAYSVTDIYGALTDPSAGLGHLSGAEVSDISCYHRSGVSRNLAAI